MSTPENPPAKSIKKEFNSPDGSAKKKFTPKSNKKKFGIKQIGGNMRVPKKFANKKSANKKFENKKFNNKKFNNKKFNKNGKKIDEKKKVIDEASNSNEDPSKVKGDNTKQKRPKLSQAYFDAAYILRMMSQKKGSINMLISSLKDQKSIKQVYALAIKVIKNQDLIKRIAEQFPPTGKMDLQLIEVLIADLVFGQKLFQKYRRVNEVLFVMERTTKIFDLYKLLKAQFTKEEDSFPQVRYFRVNLLKTNSDDLISKLEETGQLSLKKYSKEISFDEFKKLAMELEPNQFMQDYHFDDIFLYKDASTKSITSLELYANNMMAIQDKSSMLAIESMELKPGMKILDACAAPGMKSIAIASRLNNDCTLYANDMNPQRYKVLRNFLHKFGADTAKMLNVDFSQLNPAEYQDLDIILLDPSCSGSGMSRRFDYGQKQEQDELKDEQRWRKLAKFQLILLDSALKFFPKKIVYCTCSNLQQENEDVINQLLENNPDIQYEVIDPLPNWPSRGTGDYEFSSRCLRADYNSTLTSGFFCCVLQRKKDAVKPVLSEVPEENVEEAVQQIKAEADDNEKVSQIANSPKVRKSSRIKRRTGSSQDEAGSESAVDEIVPETPRKSKRLRK